MTAKLSVDIYFYYLISVVFPVQELNGSLTVNLFLKYEGLIFLDSFARMVMLEIIFFFYSWTNSTFDVQFDLNKYLC